MGIEIVRTGGRYEATVLYPEDGIFWRSSVPLEVDDLLRKLQALGCHSTDVFDAMESADPEWDAHRHERDERRRNIVALPPGEDISE